MNLLQTLSTAAMLIFGAGTAVTMKVMLGLKASGWVGTVHAYDKPFMQSLLMFFGMAFSLLISKFWDPEGKGSRPPSTFRQKVTVSIPCAFDLFASTLQTFGLIYINASIFQMLRGSMVVFSAILCMVFLHRKIIAVEWFGIGLVVVALVIIGLASVWMPTGDDDDSSSTSTTSQKLLGSLLVVASEIVQAGQIVVEQFVLHDLNMPALEVVGWEGIWGCVMMVLVAFPFALIIPGNDPSPLGSSLENFIDSFMQLGNGKVAGISAIFVVAVLGLNIFGMLVTSSSEAINRTLMEAARTVLVWIVMLIAYAANAGFGEQWSKWSWLELAGFILLICGTVIYNKVVKIPGFTYPQPKDVSAIISEG
jgi:drug/metabolite transporter (DMT)-like permease